MCRPLPPSFSGNAYGIYSNQTAGSIYNSVISGNSAFGVFNQTPATVYDARNNYWGSPSGPGPAGTGDVVSAGCEAAVAQAASRQRRNFMGCAV